MSSQKPNIPTQHLTLHGPEDIPFKLVPIEQLSRHADALYGDRHTFYVVMWVTVGAGMHMIDFTDYPIQADTIFCIAPGQVHQWEKGQELKGYALAFTEDFLGLNPVIINFLTELTLFDPFDYKPVLYLSNQEVKKLQTILDWLKQAYEIDEFGRTAILQSLLQMFLIYLQRFSPTTSISPLQTANHELTHQLRHLIEKNYLTHQKVQAYANLIGVTANHLTESVKAATGRTASSYIRQRLSLEAKRMLVHTPKTIQEISQALGFKDPSYFSRFFKRETEHSPTNFRIKFREKYRIRESQKIKASEVEKQMIKNKRCYLILE